MSSYTDGVNVDIEDPLDAADAPALTALVASLTEYPSSSSLTPTSPFSSSFLIPLNSFVTGISTQKVLTTR